jgi:CcmD family protein
MNALILATVLVAAAPPESTGGAMTAAPAPAADTRGRDASWQQYDYSRPPVRKDEIPSSTWVIIAYLTIWALLLGYVVILARRQARLRDELAELSRRIDAAAPPERTP